MSPATLRLWQRFREMPRAVQWSAWAAALSLLALLWTDVIAARTNIWNEQADKMLARLEEVRSGDQRLERLVAMQDYVVALGNASRPDNKVEDAADALADAINQVLAARSVSGDSSLIRAPDKLPPGTIDALLAPGERAYKINANLRFEATPEEAIAIIAELEARPEIEAISVVRLAKRGSNKVAADLTLEAWCIRREKSRTGGAS